MKKVIFFLLSLTVLFCQEPCEGTCLSEEQTKEVFNGLKELEFKDSTNTTIISNLNGQIKLYMEQHANDSLLISLNERKSILLNDKIKLYDELIKEVKPKWYENKWLWFGLGVVFTAGSVKLAGEIID